MEIIMANSRSIFKDPIYQTQQDKNHSIHLQKIKSISQVPLQPIKPDTTFQRHLKKAKSLSKLFEIQQNKNLLRLQNHSLLQKLMNVQPTIKSVRIGKSASKQKMTSSSSNWMARRKQTQKIEKERQLFIKHCETLSTVNVKDVKKKMQEQIRQYLQLKNSIRKMKPMTAGSEKKIKRRDGSNRKVSMGLPLWNESGMKVREVINNQQDNRRQVNKGEQKQEKKSSTGVMGKMRV